MTETCYNSSGTVIVENSSRVINAAKESVKNGGRDSSCVKVIDIAAKETKESIERQIAKNVEDNNKK